MKGDGSVAGVVQGYGGVQESYIRERVEGTLVWSQSLGRKMLPR